MTNLEYLQNLEAEDFAEWMENIIDTDKYFEKYLPDVRLCLYASDACEYNCKHDYKCEDVTDKQIILNWLNSGVISNSQTS